MKVFGITGGSGAGKTTVSRMFEKLGVRICDCDKIAREVTTPNSDCLNELRAAFGDDIIGEDGNLLRRVLAEKVFTDKEKLAVLNDITHKYIMRKIVDEIAAAEGQTDMFALDGAVIIGSPVVNLCDALVVVTADEDVRISRITERDGLTVDEARNRIRSQMSESEYLRNADYVIENNDGIDGSGEQIEQIYRKIKNTY